MMTEMITLGDGSAIPLERFIDMIAARILAKMRELDGMPRQMKQSDVYRQFGRKRVEAWVKQDRLTQYRTGKDGHSIRYDTEQVMKLAHEEQDYLFRNLPAKEVEETATKKKRRTSVVKKIV